MYKNKKNSCKKCNKVFKLKHGLNYHINNVCNNVCTNDNTNANINIEPITNIINPINQVNCNNTVNNIGTLNQQNIAQQNNNMVINLGNNQFPKKTNKIIELLLHALGRKPCGLDIPFTDASYKISTNKY